MKGKKKHTVNAFIRPLNDSFNENVCLRKSRIKLKIESIIVKYSRNSILMKHLKITQHSMLFLNVSLQFSKKVFQPNCKEHPLTVLK